MAFYGEDPQALMFTPLFETVSCSTVLLKRPLAHPCLDHASRERPFLPLSTTTLLQMLSALVPLLSLPATKRSALSVAALKADMDAFDGSLFHYKETLPSS